jgi:hypothetical protein
VTGGGRDGIEESGVPTERRPIRNLETASVGFRKMQSAAVATFSLVCHLHFLHFVSDLRVARMLFAVFNDRSSGTPHSGVLLWSIRSSTELKREKAGTLFDSRPTRSSEDEGAKIEVNPLQSNLTL